MSIMLIMLLKWRHIARFFSFQKVSKIQRWQSLTNKFTMKDSCCRSINFDCHEWNENFQMLHFLTVEALFDFFSVEKNMKDTKMQSSTSKFTMRDSCCWDIDFIRRRWNENFSFSIFCQMKKSAWHLNVNSAAYLNINSVDYLNVNSIDYLNVKSNNHDD